jgi:hypothetical protein
MLPRNIYCRSIYCRRPTIYCRTHTTPHILSGPLSLYPESSPAGVGAPASYSILFLVVLVGAPSIHLRIYYFTAYITSTDTLVAPNILSGARTMRRAPPTYIVPCPAYTTSRHGRPRYTLSRCSYPATYFARPRTSHPTYTIRPACYPTLGAPAPSPSPRSSPSQPPGGAPTGAGAGLGARPGRHACPRFPSSPNVVAGAPPVHILPRAHYPARARITPPHTPLSPPSPYPPGAPSIQNARTHAMQHTLLAISYHAPHTLLSPATDIPGRRSPADAHATGTYSHPPELQAYFTRHGLRARNPPHVLPGPPAAPPTELPALLGWAGRWVGFNPTRSLLQKSHERF